MGTTVGDILAGLEQLAPPALAESWDNIGLLVGDAGRPVTGVLTALDATPAVLAGAADCGAELLVTHHPLIFSRLTRLVEDGASASLALHLVREGRSLIAAHTNLDAAPEGLNARVAALLGVREARPLAPADAHPLLKLVTYVPETHAEAVRAAICRAGAGWIGHYRDCTFGAPGTGTFRPEMGAHPFVGEPGVLEHVAEVRLETVAPRPAAGRIVAALLEAHPYEEPAFDLLPLENAWPGAGPGRVGRLDAPTTAGDFADQVRAVLQAGTVQIAGDARQPVRTVALCTGAGGDLLPQALRAGADLFLTGEVKHHQALQARQLGIAVLAAGHFATERPAVPLLAEYLRAQFPSLRVTEAREDDPLR